MLAAGFLAAIRVDGVEIAGYEFFDRAQVSANTAPRMARRLEAALAARAEGRTRYLEHGLARLGR